MAEQKYTVTYFDMDGGRAEPIRIAFHIAKIPFVDDRVNFEQFKERKATFPFGSLPVMEVEGKGTFTQTNAMLRYVGKLTGLLPEDSWEAVRLDEVLDVCEDIGGKLSPTMRMEGDDKIKARKALAEGAIPMFLAGLEKIHKANGNGTHIVGSKLSMADLKLFYLMRWLKSGILDGIPASICDDYHGLNAMYAEVENHEAIKAYYAARPQK